MLKIFQNQKGIAHLLTTLILLVGIGVGVYVSQNPQILKGRASLDDGFGGISDSSDDFGGFSDVGGFGDFGSSNDFGGFGGIGDIGGFGFGGDIGSFENTFSSLGGFDGFLSSMSSTESLGSISENNIDKVSSEDGSEERVVANEVLVKFALLDRSLEGEIKKTKKADPLSAIEVVRLIVSPEKRQEIINNLNNDPKVEFAEPNFITRELVTIPNDPNFTSSQVGLKIVQTPQAWDISKGDSSTIAVVDTGINTAHPDLKNKIARSYNFLTGANLALDDNGHGTQVAGIIGAIVNNNLGMAGVSWNNKLLNIKVLNQNGLGTYAEISKGIIFAADQGAKVINVSVGGTAYSQTMEAAVNYAVNKGAVVVAAAGNYFSDKPVYPAYFDKVMAVGATDNQDGRTSFSNYGSWLDLVAPGVDVYSTKGSSYETATGTSMATPFVSGAAALVWSSGARSVSEVANTLKAGSDDLGDVGFDQIFGHGRLNVYKSLLSAKSTLGSGSPTQDINLSSPVSIDFQKPADGAKVSTNGKVTVSLKTSENAKKVDVYLDGSLKCSLNKTPYKCYLMRDKESRRKSKQDVEHTITARAYDDLGNAAEKSIKVVFEKYKKKNKNNQEVKPENKSNNEKNDDKKK